MKSYRVKTLVAALAAGALSAAPVSGVAAPLQFDWQVVVNNGDTIPETDRVFNSYNPPSVNTDALVVFRARSTGQQQGPVSGIYTRDMATAGPMTPAVSHVGVVPGGGISPSRHWRQPVAVRAPGNASTAASGMKVAVMP